MRYLKSYNTRARSALLGERNTLRKQDIEVDGRKFNDTHPVKCSFSLKMRFLSEVRTLIAMGISLLCVLLGFHSLHQRFCKASRSFFYRIRKTETASECSSFSFITGISKHTSVIWSVFKSHSYENSCCST